MNDRSNAVELPALKDELCASCKEPAIYRCHKCGKLFCIDHASELDPSHHCIECLKLTDASYEVAPLVDSEGIRHAGRLLRPVGNAFTQQNKLIFEMSEAELLDYIKQYKVLVQHYEQVLTVARINLTQATHRAYDLELGKLEKIGGEIVFTNVPRKPQLVKTKKEKPSVVDTLADKLRKGGITPEMIAKLIELKKAKKSI